MGDWTSILIGNGVSINLCSDFTYRSLYHKWNPNGNPNEQKLPTNSLFEKFGGTGNFERVLSSLETAASVLDTFNQKALNKQIRAAKEYIGEQIVQARDRIREGLIDSIIAIHPRHADISENIKTFSDALSEYHHIYTTNYDALVYWALMMLKRPHVDFFFGKPFCEDEVFPSVRDFVCYLHGAIFLCKDHDKVSGEPIERKITGNEAQTILDTIKNHYTKGEIETSTPYHRRKYPLIVSEGTPASKQASIGNSKYLTYVNRLFRESEDPLVILGHSLSKEHDEHIINSIKASGRKRLAIGIY